MTRTYVFHKVFIALSLIGVALLVGIAGGNDLGTFSFGELVLYSAFSFGLIAVGIKGADVCARALRPRRHRKFRVIEGNKSYRRAA